MTDWVKIRNEYISGCGNLRTLAEKYSVSSNTLRKRAAGERWKDERTKAAQSTHKKAVQKIVQKASNTEADRILRLLSIGDALTRRLSVAEAELDKQMAKNVIKTKTVEYSDASAPGRPTKEVVEEKTEIVTIENAPIDRLGLKILTDALKNLLDASKFAEANRADLDAVRKIMERLDADAGASPDRGDA